MFDWRFMRGVAVIVAILVVALGIFVALPLTLNLDAGLIVHALAAIPLI
jgi:hydrogenase/urease accessory protein HupE